MNTKAMNTRNILQLRIGRNALITPLFKRTTTIAIGIALCIAAQAADILVPDNVTINSALTTATAGDVIKISEDVTLTSRVAISNTGFAISSDGLAQRVIKGNGTYGLITLTSVANETREWTFNRITLTGATSAAGTTNASALNITGGNASSLVRINGQNLIICSNTTPTAGGAGFWANNTKVIFNTDVTFLDNTASTANGGAIITTWGAIYEKESIFRRNTSGGTRGGGVMYMVYDLVFNDRAIFEANETTAADGAAIYSFTTNAKVSFNKDVYAFDNIAKRNGGVVFSSGTVEVIGSGTFKDNKAGTYGGALYFAGNPTSAFGLKLSATSGNIIFEGNKQGASNTPNAVYYALGTTPGIIFDFSATDGKYIYFYDPITGNNGTHTAEEVIMRKSGAGSLIFDKYHTDIIATTTVSGGLFAVTNGATYGKDGASGSFTVAAGGVVGGSGTIAAGTIAIQDGGGLAAYASGALSFVSNNAVSIGENLILMGSGTIAAGKALTASKVHVQDLESTQAGAIGALHLTDAVTLINNSTLSGSGILDIPTLTLGASASDTVTATIVTGGTLNVSGNATGMAKLVKNGDGALNLNGSSFSSGAITVNGGALSIGGSSLITGAVNIAGGALEIMSGTLAAGAVTMGAGGQIGFEAGSSALTASSFAATGGSINIIGGSSGQIDLITSQTEISLASFSAISLLSNGNTPGNIDDYRMISLQLTGGNKIIQLSSALAWYADVNSHGTFKIDDGSDVISEVLADRTPVSPLGGWDGKTFTKAGAGTLILTAANTYSGTTFIQEGTLQLGNGGTIGGIASASTVVNNAELAFNRSDNVTFSNIISGSGIVVQAGAGTLELTGANSHSGGVRVDAGTLLVNSTAPLGSGTLVLNGGSVQANASNLTFGAMHVDAGGTFIGGGNVSSLSGTGVFTKQGGDTLAFLNVGSFSGGLIVNEGVVGIGSNASLGDVTLANTVGVKLDASNRSMTVKSLSGGGVNGGHLLLGNTGTLTVNAEADSIYDGMISGGADSGLVKDGAAGFTLTGTQAYGGMTIVRSGTLGIRFANAIAGSTGLRLEPGAAFDMSGFSQKIPSLSGNGGLIVMNVRLVDGIGDILTVTGTALGDHQVLVNNGGGSMPNHTQLLIKTGGGDATFTLAQPVYAGMHEYSLVRGDDSAVNMDPLSWYLYNTWKGSPAGQAILYSAGAMGTEWHYSLDNVRKRMGDIRQTKEVLKQGGSGNLWARGNAYHLEAEPDMVGLGYTENVYELTIGLDKAIAGQKNLLLLGVMVSMGYMDRDFRAQGSGESTTVGVGVYGTWMHDAGWFVDFTAKTDRFDNSMDALASDNGQTSANYISDAYGVSLEFGREFMLGKKWWVEPSVQGALAWLPSSKYSTDTSFTQDPSIDVFIKGARMWQYRAEMRTGFKNIGRWLPYARVSGVRSETTGGDVYADEITFTPQMDGWRFEAGAGLGFIVNNGAQIFVDYEYAKADRYERPWAFTVGYRSAW